MSQLRRRRSLICAMVLALAALRVATPAGYMPASIGSGLLFELCPEGLPAAVIKAFSEAASHHHHDNGADSGSAAVTDTCPVGHMLSSAIAVDDAAPLSYLQGTDCFRPVAARSPYLATRMEYLSRAPPA